MKKEFAGILSGIFMFPYVVFAGDLSATVGSTQVPYGEPFELKISYVGDDSSMLQPDLTVLQNNFAIYSTSTSIQSRFINGQSEQRREWMLSLLPKKEGKIEIPSITVGQYKTEPIELEVMDADDIVIPAKQTAQAANMPQKANVSVSLDVEAVTPFVQQEINAVLTIEDNLGVDLTSEPTFEDSADWVVRELDKPTVENQNGKRIIKFYYALFPQKSGQIQIPKVHINGVYTSFEDNGNPLNQSVGGLFKIFEMDIPQMFGVQKPVALSTKSKNIYVKPIPPENGRNWWLPAEGVSLTARWSDERPVFKVGEAVSREITLKAAGVSDTQLPELMLSESENIKQYPEKPELDSVSYQNKIIATAVIRVIYIPQRAGEQVIPEIQIPWYNIKTNQMEIARIPAEKMVIGGENPSISYNRQEMPKQEEKKIETTENTDASTLSSTKNTMPTWLWIVIAFMAGGFCSWLFGSREKGKRIKNSSTYIHEVEKNLERKDYRTLRDNLLNWGKNTFIGYSMNNLNDLSEAVKNEEFTAQMQTLNGILYAGATALLDKDLIIRIMKNSREKMTQTKDEKPLPELYK